MSVILSSGLGVAAAGFVQSWLDRYRIPRDGTNAWTQEAVWNVLRHVMLFERVIDELDGKLTSAYRSVEHNAKLPGAAANSRHLKGLAIDVVPRGRWRGRVSDAARHVYEMAVMGRIGRVHKVIEEPTWVHVSWRGLGESSHDPQLWRISWVGEPNHRDIKAVKLA